MSTPLAGKSGAVVLPGTPDVAVASITDWSMQVDAENYESSALGQDWRTYVPGLRGWQGKITGYFVADQDTNGQQAVENALLGGTSLVVRLEVGAGRGSYEGTVNVTQISVADSVKALVTFDCTFVGTGSLQHSP